MGKQTTGLPGQHLKRTRRSSCFWHIYLYTVNVCVFFGLCLCKVTNIVALITTYFRSGHKSGHFWSASAGGLIHFWSFVCFFWVLLLNAPLQSVKTLEFYSVLNKQEPALSVNVMSVCIWEQCTTLKNKGYFPCFLSTYCGCNKCWLKTRLDS